MASNNDEQGFGPLRHERRRQENDEQINGNGTTTTYNGGIDRVVNGASTSDFGNTTDIDKGRVMTIMMTSRQWWARLVAPPARELFSAPRR